MVHHRQVIAVAAVTLFGLAGCADRPNNLETYYIKPTTSAKPPPSPVPVVPAAPPTTSSSGPEQGALARTVAQAALTDADVASEGVSPVQPSTNDTGCLAALPPAGSRELGYQANWRYPTGSSLKHEIAAYPAEEGAAVVAGLRCAGQVLNLPAAPGVVLRGWFEATTCTVMIAKGHVVSAVQVTASTEVRAADAATRLAKVVAAKLSAAQP
jgi:hypothetical protein